MTTRILGMEHKPLVDKLLEVLATEENPVNQQIAIELLTAWHAFRMGDEAIYVANSMHKHVRQILEDDSD